MSLAFPLRMRRTRLWLAASAAFGAALCFLPLFDLVGYEMSFATALFSSLAAGLVGAALPHEVRSAGPAEPAGARIVGSALLAALALVVPPLALGSLNALRVPNCDMVEGLVFYLLLPVPASLFAMMAGLGLGAVLRSRRKASLAFFLLLLGSIGWSLWRFHSTPAIFAYDPFGGYFPGTLYDEVVEPAAPLVTYRVGTALAIAAMALALSASLDGACRISLRVARSRVTLVALAVLAAAGAIGIWAAGESLDHRHGAPAIARELRGRIETHRFVVHYPEGLPARDARRLAADCELRLAQVEAFFGARVHGKVRAFFFRDADEKARLVGAGQTFIAKPWRREVYLQLGGFPHPVLKHEIAHVVAGSFAPGPFHVSARAGVLPIPGLIEGAAVAAGWERDELDPHQWSRAMIDLGIAPSPEDILGLSFLGRVAAQSYTLSGSFCRFLVDRHGARAFRRVYRDGDFESAYGRPAGALVREWRSFLRTVRLAPGDLVAARARFDRPGIFGKPCAHENAQLRARVAELSSGGNDRGALRLCRQVVANDPGSVRDRVALLHAMVRAGRLAEAEATARAMTRDDRLGGAARRDAAEQLADVAWMRGDAQRARAGYEELLREPPTEDEVRLLTVKAAAAADPVLGPTVREYLLGDRGSRVDSPIAVYLLQGFLEEHPDSAIAAYLLGRRLWNEEAPELALPLLARAAAGRLPGPLPPENLRLLGAAAYLVGERGRARAAFESLARDTALPPGLRNEALDWLDRLDFEEGRRLRPRSAGVL